MLDSIIKGTSVGGQIRQWQEYFEGKRILITGAMGYIGSSVAQSFANIDCRLILLDICDLQWMPSDSIAEISSVCGDITLPETWHSVLHTVDYVFHLAALEYDRLNYDIRNDWEVNALSVFHLVETCRKGGIHPRVIFASSANIFGSIETLPVNETNRDHPPTLWSAHKLLAENYLRMYAQRYGIESVVLRLANVYGPAANPDVMDHVVINKTILRALTGETLRVFGNRDCIRDFIYIDDVISAFLHAGVSGNLSPKGEPYVIGSGLDRKIESIWMIIAEKVGEAMGKEVPVEVDDSVSLEPLDIRNFIADTSLFCRLTGWQPEMPLEQGIATTLDVLKTMN